ncbi:MAG TPA: hypothetical protein PLH68_04730, partial [Anaerolineaceae bacterium]|nr:hypothetical protein [Anaerolineaceae bacterium]
HSPGPPIRACGAGVLRKTGARPDRRLAAQGTARFRHDRGLIFPVRGDRAAHPFQGRQENFAE